MSVCYGRAEPLVFSGAATGDVYIWKEPLLLKRVKGHDGPVFAMYSLDKVCVRDTFSLSLSHSLFPSSSLFLLLLLLLFWREPSAVCLWLRAL